LLVLSGMYKIASIYGTKVSIAKVC
jgi:hypothetical protein